jgi:hypothetical protein
MKLAVSCDFTPRSLVENVADVSEQLTASFIRVVIMGGCKPFSVNIYQITRRNIPEDSHHES